MAQIDFSNAQLEMQPLSTNYNIISQPELWLLSASWWSSDGQSIYRTTSTVISTPSKVAVRYQGTIPSNATGGNFISLSRNNLVVYRITGITYNPGDTFDCTIEVEITTS